MDSYDTKPKRPSTTNLQPAPEADESARKLRFTLSFSCPFDIPPTPESGAIRIAKNLSKFRFLYAIFIWTVLFIALLPARKLSIVYLIGMTGVTFLYVILPHAVPEASVLDRIVDRRIVLFFLFVVTSMMMIATKATLHLFIVLDATFPVVMLHAVLSKVEDVFVSEEAVKLANLVDGKDHDQEDSLRILCDIL